MSVIDQRPDLVTLVDEERAAAAPVICLQGGQESTRFGRVVPRKR